MSYESWIYRQTMCEAGRYLMLYKNYSTLISGEADTAHGLQYLFKAMKVKTNAMEENQHLVFNQRGTNISPL